MLEGFLSPKASNKESLKEKIQQFKENRQQEVSPGKEESGLTGRERDLENCYSNVSPLLFYLASRVEVTTSILNTLFISDSFELSGTSDSRLTKIKNKYPFSLNHNESIKK